MEEIEGYDAEVYNSLKRDPEYFGIKLSLLGILFVGFISILIIEGFITEIVYDTNFWITKITVPLMIIVVRLFKSAKFGVEFADIMRYFAWTKSPKYIKGDIIQLNDLKLKRYHEKKSEPKSKL